MHVVISRSIYAKSGAAFLNRGIITASESSNREDAFRRVMDVLRYKWTLTVI